MSKLIRFQPLTALAITGLAVAALTSGCNAKDNPLSSAASDLCCKSFSVGADMSGQDFGLKGDIQGQFRSFAQAGSDLSVVANGALLDVSASCEAIARDLGADPDAITTASSMPGADGVSAMCDLATAQITAKFGAKGELKATLAIDYQPPVCTASLDAQANCQASCNVGAKCDANVDPPKCTGGTLVVECDGSCGGSAKAAVSCTGSCMGGCTGSCTAKANVAIDCTGTCDGTCTVDGTAKSGSGVQADGTCMGKCQGTCTPPSGSASVMCAGTCQGTCDASCMAEGNVKVKCDGKCTGTATEPKCEGGTAEVDCNVDADCKANCSASVSAKADCTPPSLTITPTFAATASVDVQAEIEADIASLKANLPKLLVVLKARGASFTAGIEGSVTAGGHIAGHLGDLSGEAVFCAPTIFGAIKDASTNFAAAFKASGSVVASVTTK